MRWADGLLLGEYTTLSFGEFPREENVSLLSQILEECPHQRYALSAKACAGILRRAKERGKVLPEVLKDALERQSHSRNVQENQGGGKGILIQNESVGTLSTLNNQSVYAYGISAYESNAMKSSNPNSGIYEADTARTLDLNGGSPACNQGGMAIVQKPICIENHPSDSRVKISKDGVVQTLSSRMGTGGNNVPMVMEPYTTSKASYHIRAQNDGIVDVLVASDYKDPPTVTTGIVRRLTPLECERLQGFPDGWTDIGDWTDSAGNVHKASDSPRYKALGNSIALPFWFYLLRRISAQYERPATLGSLFDGIGGFPLCWERCNGKGTALWASEIEEFPIAVTKKHFPEVEDGQIEIQ